MGYVDLHVHLLAGIDDGARTLEDSVAMAELLVALGFVAAAPSPHHRTEYASADRALCERTRVELEAVLEQRKVPLALYPGAENAFLDDSFLGELAHGTLRVVGTSTAVLVEAPYGGPLPTILDLIFRMRLKGYTPLLAHPERCAEFERKDRAREAVAAGAKLQLDLGSLVGKYGKGAQRLAGRFLAEGLYAVAATDMHDPRARSWLEPALAALRAEVGDQGLAALLSTGPRAILDTSSAVRPSLC